MFFIQKACFFFKSIDFFEKNYFFEYSFVMEINKELNKLIPKKLEK